MLESCILIFGFVPALFLSQSQNALLYECWYIPVNTESYTEPCQTSKMELFSQSVQS